MTKKINLTYLLLFSLMGLLFTACSDDEDDCTPPAVSANIIGSWEILGSTVEFQEDGTLIDPDDAIFGVEINDVVYDQKTYSIVGDTVLNVIAMPANSTDQANADFNLVDNQCDEITLGALGFTFPMQRQ